MIAAVVSLTGATLLAGGGTAVAADLHYQCEMVLSLGDLLPNDPVNGHSCTGPVDTGWGSVTETPTGTVYWCDSIRGQVMLGELRVFGQGCYQL
ncbi:MAG TPA: hypothetical protein VHH15_01655 [Actinophytocola sp.]|nr:hypothetical protein [Actinophytocola sp.]